MKLSMMAAAAAVLMFAGAAAAQEQGQGGGQGGGRGGACAADMAKFCADKTGPDRRQCMMDNKDKLSDGCKAAMAARMQRQQQGGDSQTPPAKPN